MIVTGFEKSSPVGFNEVRNIRIYGDKKKKAVSSAPIINKGLCEKDFTLFISTD